MSLKAIREQVKVILSSVEGVGVVHDYLRWTNETAKFKALFQHTDGEGKQRINGWMITRDKTPAETATATHDLRSHTFKIIGIYGLDDDGASEIVFQQIVEDICAAFRAKYNLNATATNTEPVQVETVEPRMFGSVLCHYCELTLRADEQENWA